jgi:hypothetical protein
MRGGYEKMTGGGLHCITYTREETKDEESKKKANRINEATGI